MTQRTATDASSTHTEGALAPGIALFADHVFAVEARVRVPQLDAAADRVGAPPKRCGASAYGGGERSPNLLLQRDAVLLRARLQRCQNAVVQLPDLDFAHPAEGAPMWGHGQA